MRVHDTTTILVNPCDLLVLGLRKACYFFELIYPDPVSKSLNDTNENDILYNPLNGRA
jgi:hypothetical protein